MINVGKFLPYSETNGPGKRSVLWLQGCLKRCRNCWNPEFLQIGSGEYWSTEQVIKSIFMASNTEGVTLLGGEPFLQAKELSYIASQVKKRGYTVMAYSGYKIDELKLKSDDTKKLLGFCDILIDGEYNEKLKAPLLWRGSTNQKIHFLSDVYTSLENSVNSDRRDFEIMLSGSELIITGNPPDKIMQSIKSLLRKCDNITT